MNHQNHVASFRHAATNARLPISTFHYRVFSWLKNVYFTKLYIIKQNCIFYKTVYSTKLYILQKCILTEIFIYNVLFMSCILLYLPVIQLLSTCANLHFVLFYYVWFNCYLCRFCTYVCSANNKKLTLINNYNAVILNSSFSLALSRFLLTITTP